MSNFASAQTEPIKTVSTRSKTVDWETVYRAEMPRIYNFLR